MHYRYCGKDFSQEDIEVIRALIEEKPQKNRKTLSRVVCERFNWRDGGLKDMSCRVAMLRMHRDSLIRLPPPQGGNGNKSRRVRQFTFLTEPDKSITKTVHTLCDLKLQLVTKKNTFLWNEYIERYHYLGYKPLPGAQLRYFFKTEDQILALLGFGAAAWTTAPRDKYIGWTHEQRSKNLHLVVNNARFLILPWIHCKNLATKILSTVAKKLPDDWEEKYNYRPVLIETFVQENRFLGTSYKAANWMYLGKTKGRGKLEKNNKVVLPFKTIWVYPLTKNHKEQLCK